MFQNKKNFLHQKYHLYLYLYVFITYIYIYTILTCFYGYHYIIMNRRHSFRIWDEFEHLFSRERLNNRDRIFLRKSSFLLMAKTSPNIWRDRINHSLDYGNDYAYYSKYEKKLVKTDRSAVLRNITAISDTKSCY